MAAGKKRMPQLRREAGMFRKKQPVYTVEREETPPAPHVDPAAIAAVWTADRKAYCEIFFEDGVYKYRGSVLAYDEDYIGYYWTVLRDPFACFFDTREKAEREAREFLRLTVTR